MAMAKTLTALSHAGMAQWVLSNVGAQVGVGFRYAWQCQAIGFRKASGMAKDPMALGTLLNGRLAPPSCMGAQVG